MSAVEELLPPFAPVILSGDRSEPPQWVSAAIGVPPNELAVLEVNTQSAKLYEAIIKYASHRAVNISEEAPSQADRIHNNPLNEAREYPGKLSILHNPPDKAEDFWQYWDDSDDDDSEDENDGQGARTYALGFGWARLHTNTGHDIIFEHYFRGDPCPEGYRLGLFRVVLLYGAEPTALKAFCREALSWETERAQVMMQHRPGRYMLYTLKLDPCGDVSWKCHGHRKSRPLSSIILREGLSEEITKDAESFLKKETKKWYREHGLPYRRNFLFHGPPGCGKTSIIRSIAGVYNLKACFMSLTHKDFNDHLLVEALSKIPRPSILIFEDVDALFEDRRGMTKSSLTFSGLLNAVDGMVSTDGVMLVMTTNHRERLDAALMRCGRVDRQFEFAPPGHCEIARYFTSFYPDCDAKDAERFADAVMARTENNARSIATLQQHFIQSRDASMEEAIQTLDQFFSTHFQELKDEEDAKKNREKVEKKKKRKAKWRDTYSNFSRQLFSRSTGSSVSSAV